MFRYVSRKASNRKRRLFACACYRHVPGLLDNECCLNAIEVSERYADGIASKEELQKALPAADHLFPRNWPSSLPTARYAAEARSVAARRAKDGSAERRYQCDLLRELFGNPFRRPPLMDLAIRTWSDGIVPKLARTIYHGRCFNHLPILADALEEAGCTNADALNHCRQSGEHVLGCWVLDLILGKQ